MPESNINMLKLARDKTAAVYEDFVNADGFDNGSLDNLNEAIKKLELVIHQMKK